MRQYEYLVLYLDDESKKSFIQSRISEDSLCPCVRYEMDTANQTLTVQYKKDYSYNGGDYQECYRFINPELCDLPMRICGAEFFNVIFLEGKYHSDDIMYALSRMRGGVIEVEGM